MIERYARAEMLKIWSDQNKFENMLTVEKAVAQVQAQLSIIPKSAARDIVSKGKFSTKKILELELKTKHDVVAFVLNVSESVGPNGRFVHFGLTSSDVLDTALSLTLGQAFEVLNEGLESLEDTLKKMVKKYATVLCAGRTHGIHAEPITFGFKMASHLKELQRNRERIERAVLQAQRVKLSGAVGTYSSLPMEVETGVAKKLKLPVEDVATQVIPRDRHSEVIWALAQLSAGYERLATELRHLQRTEVSEVIEGFSKGQTGSSAMPHKKNPISGENLTGLSRLLRSYVVPALEDVSLWHERDISHSSVERVIFPDAFLLADYATMRLKDLLKGLTIDKEQMQKNMDVSQGRLYSSHLLLYLVKKGLTRDVAYEFVQRLSHTLKPNETLEKKVLQEKELRGIVKSNEVRAIFSGKVHKEKITKFLNKIVR